MGAADLLRHRSACRSELESYAGIGRPPPSLSARAPRTEPPSAVTAHELLQHGTHCNLPTCCCSPAQQRSPCRAALVGPIGHFSRLQALRPLHSLTRTGQVNCHLIPCIHQSPSLVHCGACVHGSLGCSKGGSLLLCITQVTSLAAAGASVDAPARTGQVRCL